MNENLNQAVVQPEIIYDAELQTAPYTVKINPALLGEILLSKGWKEEEVSGLKILVKAGKDNPFLQGQYDGKKHQVFFNTRWLWNEYSKLLGIAKQVNSGERSPRKNQFSDLLVTKRLSHYLAVAPEERGMKFAQKLLREAVENRMSFLALHEVGHADNEHNPNKDYSRLKKEEILSMIKVFGGVFLLNLLIAHLYENYSHVPEPQKTILTTLIFLSTTMKAFVNTSEFSPSERSANEFADLHTDQARLNALILFRPK